ncbi:hypothetical protein [Aureimonas frigidaquae]|uniref:hypothetical protein n=1 Tax=Aureimonas frigidaquae TaxID=424757 RepID=UPI00078057FF|nr:hypothetical protein [Aureimonas frigidaquae]
MNPRTSKLILAAALALGILPARADETLLDYRDAAFLAGSPYYSAADSRMIKAALAAAPGNAAKRLADDFVLRGDAAGSFSTAGAQERVYLVQAEAAVAIDPFPDAPPPLLVVMRGTDAAGIHVLPDGVQYQRLVAAADTDGDGLDEVFLETSFMNMGQTSMSLDVAALLADGGARIVESVTEVYYDGCDNPAGARERKAATISLHDGIQVERFEEGCP